MAEATPETRPDAAPAPDAARMDAVFLHDLRDLRPGTMARPEPGDDELLLRVRSVGICGSDLHYYLEGGTGGGAITEPFVLGHEFAAEVVDDRAEAFGFAPGALVAVDPARPCGRCEWCEGGHPNLCPDVRFTGTVPYHGALREFITARPDELFPLPDGFTPDDGAMLEPLGVAIHALDLARLRPFESVAVLGAGSIGLLLLQVARACGAGRLYAVDPVAHRAEAALELGADAAAGEVAAIDGWTDGRGVDVVLEATDSPDGPEHAARAARIGGRVVLVGIPEGNRFTMDAANARRKGLTIRMSRRMGHVYDRAIAMVERGAVDVERLVTHRFDLRDAARAFDLVAARRDGVLKAVVQL